MTAQTIPLGRAAYQRAQLPAITLKNMFYERTPANLRDQVSLIPRPRLRAFANPGLGPIRGLYRKGGVMATASHSGAILALSGDKLYRVSQTIGAATLIDTVVGWGGSTGRPSAGPPSTRSTTPPPRANPTS
jgi:hypothetical protein